MRLSMLEAVVAFLWPSDMAQQTFVGDEPVRQEAASAIDLIYETADGYITAAVVTDRQWQGLVRALEKPEWLEDERFKTPALRHQNIDARLQMTQDVLIGRTSAEWLDRLTKADVPCGPVLTRSEMIRHPHIAALELARGIRPSRGRAAAPGPHCGALFAARPPASAAGAGAR